MSWTPRSRARELIRAGRLSRESGRALQVLIAGARIERGFARHELVDGIGADRVGHVLQPRGEIVDRWEIAGAVVDLRALGGKQLLAFGLGVLCRG